MLCWFILTSLGIHSQIAGIKFKNITKTGIDKKIATTNCPDKFF